MPQYLRAVAIDYDGTLTETDHPGESVLSAVREVRQAGRKVILVTGRILAELRADFPSVNTHFDAIVGENGAVLWSEAGGECDLALPVSTDLEFALVRRGVPLRRGRVLLAMDAVHDVAVLEEVRRLGLEDQIVWNRGALMVLPSGVNKGTGLAHALDGLDISLHNTVGIGDAENDHSLVDACEIGVAVANAVGSLKGHSDITLSENDGAGVAAFLRGPFLHGVPGLEPRRWQVDLGDYDDHSRAAIPASGVNLGIYGGSGTGKSYFAGLFVEGLVGMGYTVVVLDLEGDHTPLEEMRGVVTVGGRELPPRPEQVTRLLREGILAVVVDLSLATEAEKRSYALAALEQVRLSRALSGLPHWVVVEEAHVPLAADLSGCRSLDARETGVCLVTYQPELLCQPVRQMVDVVVHLGPPGEATFWRRGWTDARRFSQAGRGIGHVRHWHKYVAGQLPPQQHFVFRNGHSATGRTAANLPEFAHELRLATDDVLRHHASHHDFSRWLADLLRDAGLTRAVRGVERGLAANRSPVATEHLRERLIQLVSGQVIS